MKKLLVLSLVLGIASLATAGFSLGQESISGNVGDDLTITIESADGSTIPASIWIALSTDATAATDAAETDIVWLSGVDEDAAGSTAQVNMAAYGNQWNSMTWPTAPALGSYTDGTWATFTLEGLTAGTYTVNLENSAYSVIDSATVTIVPEPATMALLGLGALVLRRKK